MKLLGFNFTKLHAEKNSNNTKGVKVSPSIDLSDIKEANNDLLNTGGSVLSVKFSNTINYGSEYGKVEIEGNLLISVDQEVAKQVLEEWKENSIPNDFKVRVFNIISKKSTLKALELENELNMPLHHPMPRVKSAQERPQNKE